MKRHLAFPHEGTSQRTSEHGTDHCQQVPTSSATACATSHLWIDFIAVDRLTDGTLARNVVSESALKAIRDWLRKQGKLILAVSFDEFCSMLLRLDDGGDPTDELYGKLDDLLMAICR